MKEYEKHVLITPTMAYCGEVIAIFEWTFQNKGHALDAVGQQTRMQPCPKCLSKIKSKK